MISQQQTTDKSDSGTGFTIGKSSISAEELGLERHKLTTNFRERLLVQLLSPSTLVFIVILILVVGGVLLLAGSRNFTEIADYWKWITPIVSTYVGYAIGKKSE